MTGVQLLKAADEAVQKREAAKPESEKDQPLIDIRKLSSEQMEKLNTINQGMQQQLRIESVAYYFFHQYYFYS
jgi:hypothetical protein